MSEPTIREVPILLHLKITEAMYQRNLDILVPEQTLDSSYAIAVISALRCQHDEATDYVSHEEISGRPDSYNMRNSYGDNGAHFWARLHLQAADGTIMEVKMPGSSDREWVVKRCEEAMAAQRIVTRGRWHKKTFLPVIMWAMLEPPTDALEKVAVKLW